MSTTRWQLPLRDALALIFWVAIGCAAVRLCLPFSGEPDTDLSRDIAFTFLIVPILAVIGTFRGRPLLWVSAGMAGWLTLLTIMLIESR